MKDFKTYISEDNFQEAMKFWKVTITKKAGKLFKGQNVVTKARNSAEAIKKGIKQMKGNPALVPGGSVTAKLDESIKEGDGLWANIHKKRKSGRRMRKPGEKGAPTAADFKRARGEEVEEGKGPPESFEAQFKRRVVKTTKPEHKEKGYNWRIKGKDRPEISIKLYKEKPGFAEFKKQLRRVAGHEFG